MTPLRRASKPRRMLSQEKHRARKRQRMTTDDRQLHIAPSQYAALDTGPRSAHQAPYIAPPQHRLHTTAPISNGGARAQSTLPQHGFIPSHVPSNGLPPPFPAWERLGGAKTPAAARVDRDAITNKVPSVAVRANQRRSAAWAPESLAV